MDATAQPINHLPAGLREATSNITLGSKPKRPLSAFNLYYRFKRQKVLDALTTSKCDKESITRLVGAAPGLENSSSPNATGGGSQMMNDLRRRNIRNDLEDNLLPRETRDRPHRTNSSAMNGAISFLELGKLMNSSWKECDEFAKNEIIIILTSTIIIIHHHGGRNIFPKQVSGQKGWLYKTQQAKAKVFKIQAGRW